MVDSPIRSLRRDAGLTVEALAFASGLASATVYRAERGLVEPSDDTLAKIARALGCSVDRLRGHGQEGDHDSPPAVNPPRVASYSTNPQVPSPDGEGDRG